MKPIDSTQCMLISKMIIEEDKFEKHAYSLDFLFYDSYLNDNPLNLKDSMKPLGKFREEYGYRILSANCGWTIRYAKVPNNKIIGELESIAICQHETSEIILNIIEGYIYSRSLKESNKVRIDNFYRKWICIMGSLITPTSYKEVEKALDNLLYKGTIY